MAATRSAAPPTTAIFSAKQQRQQVALPTLPYDYSALEPVIPGELMELHHGKHHQAYVTNFNKAVEALQEAEAKGDWDAVATLSQAVKFNGGGHLNHSILWGNLAPVGAGGGVPPSGALAKAIDAQWGSLDKLIAKMTAAAAGVQGSGWAWLARDPSSGSLVVVTTANQDTCEQLGLQSLLAVDVWEHAYYLKYKNVRPEYLANIWKIVNWADVAARYEKLAA